MPFVGDGLTTATVLASQGTAEFNLTGANVVLAGAVFTSDSIRAVGMPHISIVSLQTAGTLATVIIQFQHRSTWRELARYTVAALNQTDRGGGPYKMPSRRIRILVDNSAALVNAAIVVNVGVSAT